MAMAVQKVFPDAKVTIGPWIDNGFYYDFDMEPLTDKDLKRIKKEMVSIYPSITIISFIRSMYKEKIFITLFFQGTEFIS